MNDTSSKLTASVRAARKPSTARAATGATPATTTTSPEAAASQPQTAAPSAVATPGFVSSQTQPTAVWPD